MIVWKKVIVIEFNHTFIQPYFLDIPEYVNIYTFSFFFAVYRGGIVWLNDNKLILVNIMLKHTIIHSYFKI